MTHLSGKVAFVTGGSRGIGASIVQRLAAEGAFVFFTFRSAEREAHAVSKSAGGAIAIQLDVANANDLAAAIASATKRTGAIDILVNNAGVTQSSTVEQLDIAEFDRLMAVNLRATYVASREALRFMPDGGRIINIGSCAANRATSHLAAYIASKAAVVGLTRGLARDVGERGICVNTVQPGPVETDMNPVDGTGASTMHGLMAFPRHGKPSDVAAMVAFLAGKESGFITGATFAVDGGYTA
jgi:3-oxoacyl-[acyl-carrier protein] reductase